MSTPVPHLDAPSGWVQGLGRASPFWGHRQPWVKCTNKTVGKTPKTQPNQQLSHSWVWTLPLPHTSWTKLVPETGYWTSTSPCFLTCNIRIQFFFLEDSICWISVSHRTKELYEQQLLLYFSSGVTPSTANRNSLCTCLPPLVNEPQGFGLTRSGWSMGHQPPLPLLFFFSIHSQFCCMLVSGQNGMVRDIQQRNPLK